MHNKLHLSKRKLLAAKVLSWGGFAGCVLTIIIRGKIIFLFFVCLAITMIGALWEDSMYQCPHCRHSLFADRADALLLKPCDFCPKCGWKVDIEIEP